MNMILNNHNNASKFKDVGKEMTKKSNMRENYIRAELNKRAKEDFL